MTSLDQYVTVWARRTPERVALAARDERLVYGELDRLANQFAHCLISAGLRPGDRVGIHADKSPRGVAGMLGALRAGGVYVPVDPHSPPARAALIAQDCDIQYMLISPRHLRGWEGAAVTHPVRHFFLTRDDSTSTAAGASVRQWSEVTGAADAVVPTRRSDPDELAYLLYTSGSTGVPKGVMISQRNAAAFVEWAGDIAGLSPHDTVASHAPFHFDLSVFDLYSSFRAGAGVFLVDEATAVSSTGMVDIIHDQEVTVWYSVPSALILMLERGNLEARGAPTVRCVFFAGEVFPVKYLRRLMLALPQAKFFNLFGPTETNVCLYYEVRELPAEDAPNIPAGRPACGDEAMILDSAGAPVPDGEIGELFIEGPTVMLGYWDGGKRSPAAHPYPTGDLVSRDADGFLRYHGRRDHMVKIRGFRVELGEVEAALLKHPAVAEVVAVALDQKLIAVVVPRTNSLSVLDVKRHCAAVLPPYMVPHDVRLLSDLPKTSTGKTDRVTVRRTIAEGAGDLREIRG